jgi:hypothetical protein
MPPMGKGTYGSKRGRPAKKGKKINKKRNPSMKMRRK